MKIRRGRTANRLFSEQTLRPISSPCSALLCLRYMVKVRDVIEAVEAAGWVYERTHGDHRIYGRIGQPGTVVIPGQLGGDVPEGTLSSICRQAGIDKATLKRGGR